MAGAGTVYLVSGLLCDETVWRHQHGALKDSFDVRIASFPGFDSIPKMAESLLEGAPERFSLAGHSMGGRVALEVYRSAGARIDRLALLNTGIYPAHEDEAAHHQVLIDTARERGMQAMAEEQWTPSIIHPDRLGDAELVSALSAMTQRNTVEQFASQLKALLERPDMRDLLPRIRCPTLVCCGRQDAWASVNQHVEMAAQIRGSTLAVIEDCGHMTTMERPEQTLKLIQQWLER